MKTGNEMIDEWLKQMYQHELEETLGTMSNIRLWILGSDGEEQQMFIQNMEDNEIYANLLREYIAEFD